MSKLTLATPNEVLIPCNDKKLNGLLYIPQQAQALVIFAHGSGSSRHSVRNQYVAHQLNRNHIATLLFDLLTCEEDKVDQLTSEYRFDIALLTERLIKITEWCEIQELLNHLKIGYFGASTGAGAALVAAATLSTKISAIVSRGGRPDLAADALRHISAPTLLIVGGQDKNVIDLNEMALSKMQCIRKLELIAGATHLFEESSTLETMTHLAEHWFSQYLVSHEVEIKA